MLKPPGICEMFGCFLASANVGLTVCRCREDKPPAQTGPCRLERERERDGATELPPDYTCDTARRPHHPATSQRNFKLYCHTSSQFELLASFSPDSLIVVIVKSAIFSKM